MDFQDNQQNAQTTLGQPLDVQSLDDAQAQKENAKETTQPATSSKNKKPN